MKLGTPGFVGIRLREAREARGLTAVSLAEMLGLTRSAVSQYEKGIHPPSPQVMEKLCKVLNLPSHFFLQRDDESRSGTIFFRSMSSTTKTARLKAEHRRGWLKKICSYIKEFLEIPSPNFPDFDLPKDPNLITAAQIENAATEARQFWGLGDGPLSNVVRLVENNGGVVARDYLDAETLDALSEWDCEKHTPYFILRCANTAVRSRLDLAHELGHILLHRKVEQTQLAKKIDFKLMETQAFRFAGAFLLPGNEFEGDLYSISLDAFRQLKVKWRVSIAMMVKRAQDLELISTDQANLLWRRRSRRGWTHQEPLDDELEIERPRLFLRAFQLLISEGLQSREDILWRLPYANADIETLAGLPRGFLADTEPSLIVLPLQKQIRNKPKRQGYTPTPPIRFRPPKKQN